MLQTLKSYSRQEAAVILAGVTSQLLPDELTEGRPEPIPINSDIHQRIIVEVYQKLRLNPQDKSEESQARVINYIGNEMSNAALANSDLHEIKNRIGQQGNLRPDAYKVTLTSAREKDLSPFVTRVQIKNTVHNADDFEHLLPGLFGPIDSDVSLFIKEYDNGSDPFTILVQGQRDGATLGINKAYRIYHSDVKLDAARTPLEILLAFIDKYGVNIIVGNQTSKFVMYKRIPRTGEENQPFFGLPKQIPELEPGTKLSSGFHFKLTENSIDIAIGYMINETKYLADLKKRK